MARIWFPVEVRDSGMYQAFRTAVASQLPRLAASLKSDLDGLMDRVKSQTVPVRTEALRNSGYVGEPVVTPTGVVIEVGFREPYALIQHERLDFKHNHGQAKYLESPLTEWANSRGLTVQRTQGPTFGGISGGVGSRRSSPRGVGGNRRGRGGSVRGRSNLTNRRSGGPSS